jgi:hypothetical protein
MTNLLIACDRLIYLIPAIVSILIKHFAPALNARTERKSRHPRNYHDVLFSVFAAPSGYLGAEAQELVPSKGSRGCSPALNSM